MELLSVEYGDFATMYGSDPPHDSRNACLKIAIAIDPALVSGPKATRQLVQSLAPLFPGIQCALPVDGGPADDKETIARLIGGVVLDLQRDLCEWPGGSCVSLRPRDQDNEYELYIESIDERVGRFSAQLAIQAIRMMLLQEQFDPRLIWLIDLVRHLRRQPRMRLSTKRVAALLGCSPSSAEWAIQELERYGYVIQKRTRRIFRPRGGRILVVDDSAQVRDLLTRILEMLGYDVITAVDGKEGLILLDWTDYKAVFVDLLMPGMDGVTFLEKARAQGMACPMFVISAYDHRWSEHNIERAGATDYLPKPFSAAEIEHLIDKHVKR
jgi:CheY-like chemotaxis protein